MEDSTPIQPNFDETFVVLIDQIRAETRLKLEKVPIRALNLSTNTLTLLYHAGFRTVSHILHPSSAQLDLVKGITEETKQEIREKLLWILRQSHAYFQKQVTQMYQAHLTNTINPQPDTLQVPTPDIDRLLEQMGLFSTRVTNALMRHGVITLRLLLMFTPELLLQDIGNLGPKGLKEIEDMLAEWGWELAKTVRAQQIILCRLLAAAFYKKFDRPLKLSTLTHLVNTYSPNHRWTEAEVAQGVLEHPYIKKDENGSFHFNTHPHISTPDLKLSPPHPETKDGKLLLYYLWDAWFTQLDQRRQEVLVLRYGIMGEDPITLEETGDHLGLTRERVRQIETKALQNLLTTNQQRYWQPLHHLLADNLQKAGGLLTVDQWEQIVDEQTVWQGEQLRPFLLPLLGAALPMYHYLPSFNLLTTTDIKAEHLNRLGGLVRHLLKHDKKKGLSADELLTHLLPQLSETYPTTMQQPAFILLFVGLLDRVELATNGRYHYLKKKRKTIHPTANSGWAGKPGTQLHQWEINLRQQFEKVAWIGQIPLSEVEYKRLCQAVHTEAQEPNYFTRVMEGQPRLVPPAVFITLMVFAARYSPPESRFWDSYLRDVWQVEYTQAFMARCRKRFIDVVDYLEQAFGLEFPRHSEGDLVAAVYRHTLLPRYVQDDLANWLRAQWQDILQMSNAPDLLLFQLQQNKTVAHLPGPLRKFLQEPNTQNTAVSIISNMAAAISLHVNDGESLEVVNDLLADTPIEQQVWQEIAQVFASSSNTALRQTKPRLTWLWSLDDDEMILRVQNITLPADTLLHGETDRLVWVESAQADPFEAEIDVEVSPWHMKTGEQLINEVILPEPDGPLDGELILLTDRDEEAIRLPVPPFPSRPVQFFRLTQQEAYGVPIEPAQVTDGIWLVLSDQPLTMIGEDEEPIEPDAELPVPYPLGQQYQWAAQFSFNLPVTLKEGAKTCLKLTENSTNPAIGRPSLEGIHPIPGLARQVQPTFTSIDISITLAYGGERLLKQASLWLQGQDGWRWQRPLSELHHKGIANLEGTTLHIHLATILPAHPNFYTAELRASLQPLLPAPLQFAVIPGLTAALQTTASLYTPTNRPQVSLHGLDESAIVHRDGMKITNQLDGSHLVTWHDLRHEPRLLLRFDKVDIPLAWAVAHFMVWLEPKPVGPFLTLEELQKSTLHAIGTKSAVSEFKLAVSEQEIRSFRLKSSRYHQPISHSPLYDMVRLAGRPHIVVKVQTGTETWPLFEVRQRPQLLQARAEYDAQKQTVNFYTGLQKEWMGNGRFIAESLSNAFAPLFELGQTDHLQTTHTWRVHLPEGKYVLRLELDGAWLPLNETAVQFTVGKISQEMPQDRSLIQEIRSGQPISPDQAEEFVLWWAEIAETGQAELTPATQYQLATLPVTALNNFDFPHLQKLWPPLAALKAVSHQPQWIADHGYLPAWVLLPHPLVLQTNGHKHQLRVDPIQAMYGGRQGKGSGRWRVSTAENVPKELVFVQWRDVSATQVQVEAGLVADETNFDWATIDIDDTYALFCCERCGRLVGARTYTLPPAIEQEHLHGRETAVLHNIVHGPYQLLADIFPERRGPRLLDVRNSYGDHSTTTYLPEPPPNPTNEHIPLAVLTKKIKLLGDHSNPTHFWASASRLLADWQHHNSVSPLGQAVFALAALLRAAIPHPKQFYKLLKEANLTEKELQTILAKLNQIAPHHLQWGLTWAELLAQHSE